MFLADIVSTLESAMKPFIPTTVDAKYDEKYYDTRQLTDDERAQVDKTEFAAPEGSILVVEHGDTTKGVKLYKSADPLARGEGLAKGVLDAFKADTANADIDTFVIPGNATSPVGAAAFAKTVANDLSKTVAAIVTGQGGIDTLFETISGGLLMAPTAKMLHALDDVLELSVKVSPLAKGMVAKDVQDMTRSVHETATLFEILKDQMVKQTETGLAFRAPKDRKLKMIIGHSKGNWAILTALLNFELNIVGDLPPPKATDPKVDIVTLGNWVNLPNMKPLMLELFHYHQFVGTHDVSAMLASMRGYAQLGLHGRFAKGESVDHSRNPDEYLYWGCKHPLQEGDEPGTGPGLPLNAILKAIQ